MKKLILLSAFLILTLLCQAQKEKRAFIGITIGPSWPVARFASNSLTDEYAGFAKPGYSDCFINFGYRFFNHLGLAASVSYDEYNITNSATEDWWQVVCITAGPSYTLNLNKLAFDFKAMGGYIGTTWIRDSQSSFDDIGTGIGFDLRASARYAVFKRWGILTEIGYVTAKQHFGNEHKAKVQAIRSGIGIAFLF